MNTLLIKRMTKRIKAADGKFRRLVSYDGVTWHLDEKDARRRERAAQALHKGRLVEDPRTGKQVRWIKQRERQFDVANDRYAEKTSVGKPVILPVEKRTSPFLGKAKGKNQKYKKNLKPQKVKEVRFLRPIHHHICKNCQSKFICSCDTPYFRRRCGGDTCLSAMLAIELAKMARKED